MKEAWIADMRLIRLTRQDVSCIQNYDSLRRLGNSVFRFDR